MEIIRQRHKTASCITLILVAVLVTWHHRQNSLSHGRTTFCSTVSTIVQQVHILFRNSNIVARSLINIWFSLMYKWNFSNQKLHLNRSTHPWTIFCTSSALLSDQSYLIYILWFWLCMKHYWDEAAAFSQQLTSANNIYCFKCQLRIIKIYHVGITYTTELLLWNVSHHSRQ